MQQTQTTAIEDIVMDMEAAWNESDAVQFARYFAEDADFVNVYGMYGKGREAIAKAHDAIFRTVYAGSVVAYTVRSIRLLSPDVALAHIDAQLFVPQGPLTGQLKSLPSMVLTRERDTWKIASFHNTFVTIPPPLHNNGQPRN